MLTVMRLIKITVAVTIKRHYEKSRLEVGICTNCAHQLKWVLRTQRCIVFMGGALIGSYLVYRLQRYVDPVSSFELTSDSLVGYLVGVSILGTLSGALLSVMCYHALEQPWLRTTAIYKTLTSAKDGSVGIRIGRPRRQKAA
jgi:hypothetical protein